MQNKKKLMKQHYITLLCLLAWTLSAFGQNLCEQAFVVTDKDCYLVGERLCLRIDVTLDGQTPSPSRVAYIELSDTRQLYAQTMVDLEDGQGWAEVPLPQRMHSGTYQLTAYTRAMQAYGKETFFHAHVGVINGEQLSRHDNIRILPYSDYKLSEVVSTGLIEGVYYRPGEEITIKMPKANQQGCAVSISRTGIATDLAQGQPSLPSTKSATPDRQIIPEYEGHIVRARVTQGNDASVEGSRLAMVGKMAALYDGQPQKDGSFLYFTSNLNGSLPVMVNSYDTLGNIVPMTLVSPYATILPQSLPMLKVYSKEEELHQRATAARQQAAINKALEQDTLAHSLGFMSATPDYFYDLDEYTQMNDIRELLVEFVRGVQRRRHHGRTSLYTYQPESQSYSKWPALVLLDGMPVSDIDEILNYDAHLVRFVQIYTQRFSFGKSYCHGVISFITRGGRLSNYQLKAGTQLMSYGFPQRRPQFINYTASAYGTQLWLPAVHAQAVTFHAPQEKGRYRISIQGRDDQGLPFRKISEFEVK